MSFYRHILITLILSLPYDGNISTEISAEPITDLEIFETEEKFKNKFTSGSDNIHAAFH